MTNHHRISKEPDLYNLPFYCVDCNGDFKTLEKLNEHECGKPVRVRDLKGKTTIQRFVNSQTNRKVKDI